MEKDPDNPVKEYTGVWIPREVMECECLSNTEKLAYGEIACFMECYASNEWLANRLNCSKETATRCVSHLVELGFVERVGFNGRFRIIRVVKNYNAASSKSARVVKNDESALSKMTSLHSQKLQPENKVKNKVKNNLTTKVVKGASADLTNYGDPSINEMFDLWEQMFGYRPKSSKQNRNACHTMLVSKSKGREWLINTMKIAKESRKDKYAPKEVKGNAGFFDLQRNCDNIWNWGSAKNQEIQNNSGVIRL